MTDTQSNPRIAYSPQEAAELLGCSVKTIYREIKAGNLAAKKIGQGRAIRISAQALTDFFLDPGDSDDAA